MPSARTALQIVPANTTTMAPESTAHCPEFTRVLVARVPRAARSLVLDDLPTLGLPAERLDGAPRAIASAA